MTSQESLSVARSQQTTPEVDTVEQVEGSTALIVMDSARRAKHLNKLKRLVSVDQIILKVASVGEDCTSNLNTKAFVTLGHQGKQGESAAEEEDEKSARRHT